jgi:glycosyltransferase involved in cell wall biosynthesis
MDTYIAVHDLHNNLIKTGWVDSAEIKHYLASADAAWLPGLRVKQYHKRAVSTKLLESMVSGLPIVTSDHPHRKEFVDEANCGFCVAADDPAAHARAVRYLFDRPGEAKEMGRRGRDLVLGKYTWEKEEKTLLNLYRKLLAVGG